MAFVLRIVLVWVAATLAAASAAAQPASPPSPIPQGTLVSVQGRVEHAAAARTDAWAPATLKQSLFTDDRVRTLAASRAAILFIDETQVRLNAGATLTVQAVKKGAGAPTSLDLLGGEGWFRTKNPASGLTIKTPAATAAIRGTEINLQVAGDGESISDRGRRRGRILERGRLGRRCCRRGSTRSSRAGADEAHHPQP